MGLYASSPRRRLAAVVTLVALVGLPWVLQYLDQGFYVSFASRVLIFALAATSLNLVIGFGGMVSFGHAAFFGAGAYSVAVLAESGIVAAGLAWPAAVGVGALLALLIGAISLRTRGVYFIMITLAFAQMAFYLVVSLKTWGGDDGLSLLRRSTFGSLDLKDDTSFYFVVLATLALALVLRPRYTVYSRKRNPDGGARLRGFFLQAGVFRDRRRAGGIVRCPAGKSDRIGQPESAALDAVRYVDGDDCDRRGWQRFRWRRRGCTAAGL